MQHQNTPLLYVELKAGETYQGLARIRITAALLRMLEAAIAGDTLKVVESDDIGWVKEPSNAGRPSIHINEGENEPTLSVKSTIGGASMPFPLGVLHECVSAGRHALLTQETTPEVKMGCVIDTDAFSDEWGAHGPNNEGMYDYPDVAELDPHTVWSVLDCDDGSLVAAAGFHVVNVIGYLVTTRPWVSGEESAVWVSPSDF